MLEVENYSKVYGEQRAVAGLTFSVDGGEVLGLVGPNGAGKTTTLRAVAGILRPTSGRIRIEGLDVVKSPIEAKSRLAFVPDDPPLFASLTVDEHLELVSRLYRVSDGRERAERLVGEFELAEHRKKMADELSRGMRQKVAVACALLHEPRVLLLDEPLTGLDPRGIRTLYDAIRRHAAEGGAVILSSHLLGQIDAVCSSFLILVRGEKRFHGSKSAIREQIGELEESASLEEIFFRATESPSTREAPIESAGEASVGGSSAPAANDPGISPSRDPS